MNLKTTFHYSYFIHPFIVSDGKYIEFISKFLKDDGIWKLSMIDNVKDLDTHVYFLPYVKKFLFPTLDWSQEYKNNFHNMSYSKQVAALSKLTSVKYEYKIDKDNNYNLSQTDINFKILKIELLSFETGICFLIFKTELNKAGGINSDDILNFNYKFRTINPRYLKKKKTEGITIMNREFSDVNDLSSFIEQLLYGFEDIERENIYFDRLFTYSYMCLSEDEWNENRELNEIINEFYKFLYVLPSEQSSTFDPDFKGVKENTYTRWRFSIYGFSRESGVVFSSERENFNVKKLPFYYETMYFYIFLLAFYQRIALILFSQELMSSERGKMNELKSKFTKFTHFSWFSQITNSEQGMDIWKKWQKAFDLHELFDEVQKEYTEFYDYTVAKGQGKINSLLIVIYTVSLAFSGMTLLFDFKIINVNDNFAKVLIVSMIIIISLLYPIYLIIIIINRVIGNFKRNGIK